MIYDAIIPISVTLCLDAIRTATGDEHVILKAALDIVKCLYNEKYISLSSQCRQGAL